MAGWDDFGALAAPEWERIKHAAGRRTPFLVYRDGARKLHVFPLPATAPNLTIGRAPGDLTFAWDMRVSRLHAELRLVNDTWTIVDDGLSSHGTYVNGERVYGRRRLAKFDTLRFGGVKVVFWEPREPDVTARPEVVRPDELTQGQRAVLECLTESLRRGDGGPPPQNKAIAKRLGVSLSSVNSHIHRLFERFEVDENLPQNHKRAQLARSALDSGLLG